MIYTSFVSKNTEYEKVVKKYLIPSLEKLNLRYYIDYIEDRGSWINNVKYKPEFIKKMLIKHKEPIISLDADATVEKYPELFSNLSNEVDIAVHYLDWKTWYQRGNKKELLGGTIYFNYSKKVLDLVEYWIYKQKEVNNWSQKVLEDIIKDRKDLTVYKLPLEYCYIKNLPNGKEPFIKLSPVILHHQVSRDLRNK